MKRQKLGKPELAQSRKSFCERVKRVGTRPQPLFKQLSQPEATHMKHIRLIRRYSKCGVFVGGFVSVELEITRNTSTRLWLFHRLSLSLSFSLVKCRIKWIACSLAGLLY